MATKLWPPTRAVKGAYEEDEEPEQLAWKLLAHRNDLDLGPQLQLDTCDKNNLMRVEWVNPQPLIEDDVGGLVKAYIQENCNFGIWLKIIEQIDGTDHIGGMGQHNGNMPPKKRKTNGCGQKEKQKLALEVVAAPDPPPFVCRHEVYEEDITYRAEPLASFCNKGCYLYGVPCAHCNVSSVGNGMQVGTKQEGILPIYCCVYFHGWKLERNYVGDICKHGICSACWKKGVCPDTNNNGPSARKSSRQS
jgi:hypothetical protein